jgi:uncharacterized protein YjbI with pentapeptide repeats
MVSKRTFLTRRRWWRERNRSWWWSTVVVITPIVILTSAAVLVLTRVVDHSDSTARLEMIKVALAVGAGTGAALTLVLARRRQWATEHDAAERRLTELYVKAVEQLGSEQAAVRHGGLYALERVAQDNPDHRQTVVDVICAYLRAPYTPPPTRTGAPWLGLRRSQLKSLQRRAKAAAPPRHYTNTSIHHVLGENRALQEREVRLTAQRILTRHLRARDDSNNRLDTYWPEIDLDLTGATLIDFDLRNCTTRKGNFNHTQFSGAAGFDGAQFTGNAWFDEAQFAGDARFDEAQFAREAGFNKAQFAGDARFDEAQFAGDARFDKAQFGGAAGFDGAQFTGNAWFDEAQFTEGVPEALTRLFT